MSQSVYLFQEIGGKMLDVSLSILVADTKMIFGYNFVAPLMKLRKLKVVLLCV